MSSAPPTARPELMLLLADAKDQPGEDRLRLILADWLEDSGRPLDQARAELIRAQIALSRLPPEAPERSGLDGLARRLLQRHGRAWLLPAAPWLTWWTAVRGLWSVKVRTALLRGRAMSALAGTEAWAWVEEVHLKETRPGDLAALKNHPLLGGLTGLGVQGLDLRGGEAEALARLPWLRSIERLRLNEQLLNPAAMTAILSSPYLGKLRELELGGALLVRQDAETLASSPAAGQIEKLALWGNRLHGGAAALLQDTNLRCLRHLDLRRNQVGDRGACRLAVALGAAGLHFLDLSDNEIGDVGARALAGSPHLDNLKSLILWGNPVGPEGAAALRQRFGPRVHVSPVA
jgi:uncharacterized protein (TIGR02996 family)